MGRRWGTTGRQWGLMGRPGNFCRMGRNFERDERCEGRRGNGRGDFRRLGRGQCEGGRGRGRGDLNRINNSRGRSEEHS